MESLGCVVHSPLMTSFKGNLSPTHKPTEPEQTVSRGKSLRGGIVRAHMNASQNYVGPLVLVYKKHFPQSARENISFRLSSVSVRD